MIHMGELIQTKRIQKGLSTRELAKLTCVTADYIRMLENGQGSIPFDKIARIANALDMDIRELADIVLKN